MILELCDLKQMQEAKCLFTYKHFVQRYKDNTNDTVEDITDGYHTFKELYDHRAILSAVIFNTYKKYAWKSKLHSDGSSWEGLFNVGVTIPNVGIYSYHYNLDRWDMFDVPELDKAPEYDGHTPDDVSRLLSLLDLDNDK